MSKNKHTETKTREITEKTDETEYAIVTKVLGGCRFMLKINMQNREAIGVLRGKLRNKKKENIVGVNSVVLISFRDFTEKQVDILHVYNDSEAKKLRKTGELVEEEIRGCGTAAETEDCVFDFSEI